MRALRTATLVVSVCLASVPVAGASPSAAPPARLVPYRPGRLIVKMRPWVTACVDCLIREGAGLAQATGGDGLDRLNRRHGLRAARPLRRVDGSRGTLAERAKAERERMSRGLTARNRTKLTPDGPIPMFSSTYVLEFAPHLDMEAVAREYAMNPAVEYAEPDRRVSVRFVPNDPYFSSSGAWGQSFPDLWGLHLVGAEAAWDVARGAGVVIAIIDTGIDAGHPDLASSIWVNPGEIPGNHRDDDGNGYVDDVNGWNFVDDSGRVDDDNGHGTHVAGTAAASGNDGTGILGVAWESRVMAVKGLDADGNGYVSDLAEAILYAVDNGAAVVNASWGGPATSTMRDVLAAAHGAGVVVVAAAGNDAADLDGRLVQAFDPSDDPNAISVSAFTHADRLAPFSNFGTSIDVAAPGGGDDDPAGTPSPERSVLSLRARNAAPAITGNGVLVVGDVFLRQAGTSMAAPHVAGAAAVLLSARPDLSPEQVRQALRLGADDTGAPGWDVQAGYGRLNVAGALAVESPAVAHLLTPLDRAVSSGTPIVITGSASGPGFVSYTLEYTSTASAATWTPIVGPVTNEVQEGELGVWTPAGVPDGQYRIRLRVQDVSGRTFEDRVVVFLEHLAVTAPAESSMLRGGLVEIRGSASVAGFERFVVEQAIYDLDGSLAPWSTAGISLSGGGLRPVTDDLLATFDSAVLPGGRQLFFRLRVDSTFGTTYRFASQVIIDPSIRSGWPRQLPVPPVATERRGAPTLADLDGDGTQEILVPNRDAVYVLRPDGTDAPGWPQPVWNANPAVLLDTSGPSAADLDGDGRLEVVASTGDQVFVFRYDGTLAPGWPKPFPGVEGGDCTLADLDGDGRRDIVFRLGESVAAVRLDGSMLPGFPAFLDGEVGRFLAVGDVDGDGSRDIAAITKRGAKPGHGATVDLAILDAAGHLKPSWPKKVGKTPVPVVPDDFPPILADLDLDGRLDVVVNTNKMNQVRAYRGDGRRLPTQFQLPPFKKNATRDSQDPVTAGDVNGDGVPELLVSTDRRVRCQFFEDCELANDYLGAIRPGVGMLPGWPIGFPFLSSNKIHGAGSASIADLDGDGKPEIVVGSGICDNWAQVSYPRCSGVWAFTPDGHVLPGFPKPTLSPGGSQFSPPAIGDLDGDGRPEIVWVLPGYHSRAHVVVWNVPGTPGPEHTQWPMARRNAAHTGALSPSP
jgi:subtilisin family serine protease